MSELYKVFMAKVGSKERTAKVYAATVRRIHRELYKKELDDKTLAFVKRAKTLNYVKKIVNLTRRKNAATALLMALKAVGESEKLVQKYRTVMMAADADYQKFLLSGQRKRPYANAEKAWGIVVNLHKKVNKEIEARRLWDLGPSVSPAEYRVLMAWIYLKWLAHMPPRRLVYADTRLVTKDVYEKSAQDENYVVMKPRKWVWKLHRYKQAGKSGTQTLDIPGPLKAALNKMRPIIQAKNDKGFIFQNNKFSGLSRSQFSTFVKWVFARYAGKKWSQNTIRSIKVSSVWVPSAENPLTLAKQMGHTMETAMLHYRASNTNSATDANNTAGKEKA